MRPSLRSCPEPRIDRSGVIARRTLDRAWTGTPDAQFISQPIFLNHEFAFSILPFFSKRHSRAFASVCATSKDWSSTAMKVEVRPSPIHGKGVFATETIRRGERIGRYVGYRTKRDGRYVLWVTNKKGEWQGYRGYGRLRFLNHRSTPNAEFRGIDLYAIRTIRAGEEITFHYGEEWEDVA